MAPFNAISKSLTPTPQPPLFNPSHLHFPHPNSHLRPPAVHFSGHRRRTSGVVTRAGPTSTQYVFAFVFPFSLLLITAFTAFRIGDKLDQKFLEELAMNEAIRAAEEEEEEAADDAGEVVIPRKEEPALSRTRNRPKREV